MTDLAVDIVAFIRTRIAEDERAARSAKPGPWKYDSDLDDPDPCEDEVYSVHDGEHGDLVGDPVCYVRGKETVGNGVHIARQNPDRVLRGVEAKRGILDDYDKAAQELDRALMRARAESVDGVVPDDVQATLTRKQVKVVALEYVVLRLATEYSDHKDFCGWQP